VEQSYRTEAAWSGSGPPERFSRSTFTLRQARLNPLGRLSGSESTAAADLTPTDPGQLDFGGQSFTNWRTLSAYAQSLYPIGLTLQDPLDRLVVLRPAGWGERSFDELQQRFCWRLQDEEGALLPLTLYWTGVNESAIEFLEAVNPSRDRLTGVLCHLAFAERGLLIEPLALFSAGTPQGDQVLNPAFDKALIASKQSSLLAQLRKKYGRDRIATTLTADDEWDAENPTPGLLEGAPVGIRARLAEVERSLLRLAEAGLRRGDEARPRLGQLAAELDRVGLPELAAGLNALAQAGAAATLLRAGYLYHLHRESLGLVLAGAAP
jgi:hypothetical protein